MNNFHYYYSKQLIKIFNENQNLLNLIFSIGKQRSDYVINPQDIINIVGSPNDKAHKTTILQSTIKRKNSDILEIIRSERPNKVYKKVNILISDLNLFDKSFNEENKLIQFLKDFPEKHTDAYSEKQSSDIFNLIEVSSKITQSIRETMDRAHYTINEFEKSSKKLPIDYVSLRIGSDQDIPMIKDLILIFKNLEELYNFVCFIHKIDREVKPLLLNNIYTGSWYCELFGIKQVVLSIENLLKGIGQFIRDYITGKISREKYENECKKAEAFIHLIKIAKENGIDNPEVGILKNLNPLIDNFKTETTTVIEVNEEEILKLRELDKLTLLEKKKQKRKMLLEKINLNIEEGNNMKPDKN